VTSLRTALAFLTVLPVGASRAPAPGLGRAWFPLVGLLLGLAAWAAFWLGTALATPLLGAVAAVAVLAVLTGALHLDGLADAADGLLGGSTPERRLEIMRDPRVGSFGVVAVGLVLLGDVAALAGLGPRAALAALLTAAALGRLAVVVVILLLPYARPGGLGTAAAGGRRLPDLAAAAVTGALPLALDWRHGLLAAGLVALAAGGVAALARSRVGGATGDVYGTVVEVGQLAALAGFAVRL
jgi:adenosylcobinamide-GDP ribazoletransferase